MTSSISLGERFTGTQRAFTRLSPPYRPFYRDFDVRAFWRARPHPAPLPVLQTLALLGTHSKFRVTEMEAQVSMKFVVKGKGCLSRVPLQTVRIVLLRPFTL